MEQQLLEDELKKDVPERKLLLYFKSSPLGLGLGA